MKRRQEANRREQYLKALDSIVQPLPVGRRRVTDGWCASDRTLGGIPHSFAGLSAQSDCIANIDPGSASFAVLTDFSVLQDSELVTESPKFRIHHLVVVLANAITPHVRQPVTGNGTEY